MSQETQISSTISSDLTYARLVQVASGHSGPYGPEQFKAIEALGYEFLEEIQGPDLPHVGQSLGDEVSFGYVCLSAAKECLICFRGTDPRRLLEWMDDAVAITLPTTVGKGLVHGGFLGVYQGLRIAPQQKGSAVVRPVEYIKGLLDTSQALSVVVAGHSLGGALTTLTISGLDDLGYLNDLEAVTFASPRVGDSKFVDWYNAGLDRSSRRYENPWDLVPNLPPRPPFEHVDTKVRLKAPIDLDLVHNHVIETYIALLEKA
jgi:predicted lipase